MGKSFLILGLRENGDKIKKSPEQIFILKEGLNGKNTDPS